ncbi:MAG: hypothetical protein IPK16_01175 [Anaerolineales bacterium]|nr:hypothetical protein [Anaerolineales bacterium]
MDQIHSTPLLGAAPQGAALYQLVYSTLYKVDAAGAATPDLVERAEVTADGLTWRFRLHEFVRFHDDKPLTADDVVFSINLYKHYSTMQTAAGDMRWIANIWTEDGRTVGLRLVAATPDIQENWPTSIFSPNISGAASTSQPSVNSITAT